MAPGTLGSDASRPVDPQLRAQVAAWLAQDPDPVTRAELSALVDADDWDELAARFAGRLTFGTAGLRAELGAGPLRMNRLVVRQAAAGLLRHVADLRARAEPRAAARSAGDAAGRSDAPARRLRLVVGHDARHGSPAFASDTAAVAAAAGAEVVWFDRPLPTPVLAFAVRHLGADAGVMVTASHNPPADNGYKVYLGDGAQIIPPHDAGIAAAIDAVAAAGPVPVVDPPAPRPADGLLAAYADGVVQLSMAADARDVTVVYTPLCGVGGPVLLDVFARAGFAPPHVVAGQARPDPDFPGLPFPNPEEPGVMDQAVALAGRCGADVVLANDPDADRLGVAVPEEGGWRRLTGNEIGALLADHLLRHSSGPDRLLVASIVSSRLVERMAREAGARFVATLTGFKWIVRPGLAHPEWRFLFGYEEALGFSVGPLVWDKDGISAALVFAELVAELRAAGSSPVVRLVDLARRFGLHATRQWSIRFPDRRRGAERAAELMRAVRARPPAGLAGQPLREARDLLAPRPGDDLAAADVVLWDLADGSRVTFRPSGTEPKLKVYFEVVRPVPAGEGGYDLARARADAALDALQRALVPLLGVAA